MKGKFLIVVFTCNMRKRTHYHTEHDRNSSPEALPRNMKRNTPTWKAPPLPTVRLRLTCLPWVMGEPVQNSTRLSMLELQFSYTNASTASSWMLSENSLEKKTTVYCSQGVTKRCLLSWLTNSVLVYEPKSGGRG
jgi:hypothetical protein